MRPAPYLPEMDGPDTDPRWGDITREYPRYLRIDAAAQRDRDVRFFRGLAVGVPLSLLLWGVILWAVMRWL